jgi:glycosyltransferase involved in cell wall biosynthesis
MSDLVTIGVPVYKRLGFLPNVLRSVSEQKYPAIELIVSDNGLNGGEVPQLVRRHYSKPFKFRQSPSIVSMPTHFNQIIQRASGKYFMILCDDDEISPNFVSEMAALLARYPSASVALSRQEIMDESGKTIRTSSDDLPPIVSGPEFIKSLWRTSQYKFAGLASFFSRTQALRACGGYPELWRGHSHDDALVVKLCLDNHVAMSSRATFRFRVYQASHGLSISIDDIARATRELLQFVNSDPKLQQFAAAHPAEWREIKDTIDRMNWGCYYERWSGIYRQRLSFPVWVKAAFALPFIPAYYSAVSRSLLTEAATYLSNRIKTACATTLRN